MTDEERKLVERLRVWPYGIRLEAADAITRIASERDKAHRACIDYADVTFRAAEERDAARREIVELRERLGALAEAGQQ